MVSIVNRLVAGRPTVLFWGWVGLRGGQLGSVSALGWDDEEEEKKGNCEDVFALGFGFGVDFDLGAMISCVDVGCVLSGRLR
jgi:hypothetical protein